MSTERTLRRDPDSLAHLRDAALEGVRTLRAAATKLPLEGWLAAVCIVVVLWAVEGL